MGFFDIFRRAPAIREAAALADFIDGNAAFLIQKGMYEYSRARAGHYAKVLMSEPEFLAGDREVALAGVSARPRHGGRDGREGPACSFRRGAPRRARCARRPGAVGVRPLPGAAADRRPAWEEAPLGARAAPGSDRAAPAQVR